MRFKDRTAVITGAGNGLGARYAEDLASEGASVVLVGRKEEKLQDVARRIREKGGDALVAACDISDEKSVIDMINATLETYGGVDILINNAAAFIPQLIEETDLGSWNRHISVNLTGTFLCCRQVIPHMKAKKYGKIVNITSSAVKHHFPGFGAYAASKAGIESLTRTLSEELKFHDININSLCLGMTDTDHTRERLGKDPAVTIALEDMLKIEDVSQVVLFLASDQASSIMGASIDVFGKKA